MDRRNHSFKPMDSLWASLPKRQGKKAIVSNTNITDPNNVSTTIKLNELVSSVEEIKDKLRDTFDSQPNDADYFTTTFGNEELFAIHTSCL